MTKITAIGIDPGIANTGLAVVASDGIRYDLVATRLVQTSPKQTGQLAAFRHLGSRLRDIERKGLATDRPRRHRARLSQQKCLQ